MFFLQANFETPFVVYLHNCFFLAETKPVFTFEHPNFSRTRIDSFSLAL